MTELLKRISLRKLLPWMVVLVIVVAVGLFLFLKTDTATVMTEQSFDQSLFDPQMKMATSTAGELPNEADFEQVAENSTLILLADRHTGHFKVLDKRDGSETYSYPNPKDWSKEKIGGAWRSHLLSPVIMETTEKDAVNKSVQVNSLLSSQGGIMDWERIDKGFKLTFALPALQLLIPVEVRLSDDFIETTINDSNIKEGKDMLLSLKLYPFLGSTHPGGEENYLLLPDGSGALYHLKDNVSNDKSVYREQIYGGDYAFNSIYTNRRPASMPIVGMKSDTGGVLTVADEGEEYGYIYAAPSGVYSNYAWATIEHNYRLQYYQPTSQSATSGFYTYSKVKFNSERKVRHYILPQASSSYSAMAAVYRDYLIEKFDWQTQQHTENKLPLYIDLIGGDRQKGFLSNDYIVGTTTSEAKQIVQQLHDAGIPNLAITYTAWQKGGLSNLTFDPDVEKKLGGNKGMQDFVAFAQAQGDTVMLEINYTMNTDGKKFDAKRDGLQDQAGTLLQYVANHSNEKMTLVSPLFSLNKLQQNIASFSKLGANGLSFVGIGSELSSDYNRRNRLDRDQSTETHQQTIAVAKEVMSQAAIRDGHAYVWKDVDVIRNLPTGYSYDLFVDEAIPFAQMTLHGIVPYTLPWGNMRDEYRSDFLKGIEYGAIPSFGVMHAPSEAMKDSYSIWQYSLNYDDWEEAIVQEYERFNAALGDVQNEYMINHRTIATNVKETTYSGGKKIIVNYNDRPVTVDTLEIAAQDFIVVEGGE
ncbi:DUF5696 domain-containing protein [Paenibacillus yanchengensis]|uniref:DUF5696 domain-containing protein n=1 Tax=Paenibacillus yanchengensis TaxID=2035833 RepID=A0ABW4YHH6_9BACL